MFNLTEAKFIPQANVLKSENISEELLVKIQPKVEKPEWDLKYSVKTERWKIKPAFLENTENGGYTAALQDGNVFLIKTQEDIEIEELKPKFLKNSASKTFTSNLFNLLVTKAGFNLNNDLELFLIPQEVGEGANFSVYLLSDTKEVLPVVENNEEPEVLTETEDIIPSTEISIF